MYLGTRRKRIDPLLAAYSRGNDSLYDGMLEIATSLKLIADAINRHCDIIEKQEHYSHI